MKPRYILAISVLAVVLFLGAVAAFMWWQEEHGLLTPVRGEQIPVTLVPEAGIALSARYYASPGKVESRGVVLLHELDTNQDAWNDLAAELQDKNFEVMTFDFRNGEASQFKQDAVEAVRYLREVNKDMHIALVGAGLGANVAMQLAAQDTSLTAAVLISPQYNYRGVKITQPNRSFNRPIFYVVGDKDEISAEATNGLFQASTSPAKQLREFDSKQRGTDLLRTKPKARQAIIDWLTATL